MDRAKLLPPSCDEAVQIYRLHDKPLCARKIGVQVKM